MNEELLPFDMVSLLDSDEAIKEYLFQVLNDGDSKELMRALGYVAKAKGMTLITKSQSTHKQELAI
ncbi:MAG: addiction module antidote protein [Methylococcaceae bacterium]|jgi:probable addiction module antidote protein